MANKRDLKKDINYVLGDIIEAVYLWELENPEKDNKSGEAIIDEAITSFDGFMARANERKLENANKHFKTLREDLEAKANDLVKKVNSL
ncbi:hypothetical protein [Aquimarina muelleri]|uniref:Uncharacterized protein n=1 Tax=Aquimarina muelleri TaxID=279356 RepID=A0A918JT41_9FLAO|nr:hypothetical protein [Aquimarina muelleri]MCX2761890.1 hypothetical protein [Aquimarina muelleri]GGX10129.1 hypothetical protein GCM10007384_09810 [Aquimarina muelleri]